MRVSISVILPVKDAAATVGAAIDSCRGQSFTDWELLVVDDGSSDGSRPMIEDRGRADARIRVLETAPGRRGVVAAHHAGVEAAHGTYIARMDADDVSYADRFESQLQFLQQHPEISVCGAGVRIRRRAARGEEAADDVTDGYREYERWLNSLHDPRKIAAERFIESPVAHATAMLRRKDLLRVGGYRDVAWAEDYDLWLRYLEGGYRMANLEAVLVEWWDSPDRMTRNDARYSQGKFLEAKAHYLARREDVRAQGVCVCGAGPIGKKMAALLRGDGIEVKAFIEVHPRRIGERIGGAPVRDRGGIPVPGEAVLLGAVGLKGARDQIRALAKESGYREGEDFFCVA